MDETLVSVGDDVDNPESARRNAPGTVSTGAQAAREGDHVSKRFLARYLPG
jgi:hypothetical protein